MTSSVNLEQVAFPPKSAVRARFSLITSKQAFSMRSANGFRFMYLNIMIALSRRAVGLALSWPAMSGAVPWTCECAESNAITQKAKAQEYKTYRFEDCSFFANVAARRHSQTADESGT